MSNPAGYECFEGHYCPSGQGWPLECPFGNFTNTTGQSECTICQEGWWVADLNRRFVNLFVDVFVVTWCCLWLIWQLWKKRGKCLNNVLVFFFGGQVLCVFSFELSHLWGPHYCITLHHFAKKLTIALYSLFRDIDMPFFFFLLKQGCYFFLSWTVCIFYEPWFSKKFDEFKWLLLKWCFSQLMVIQDL